MDNGFRIIKANADMKDTYWTLILINDDQINNIDCYYDKTLALLNEYICTYKLENSVYAIVPVRVPADESVDEYIHDFVDDFVETCWYSRVLDDYDFDEDFDDDY